MCTHHYRIETPHGPTVTGTCQHCGHTRTWESAFDPLGKTWGTISSTECPDCGRVFTTKGGLTRHARTHLEVAA